MKNRREVVEAAAHGCLGALAAAAGGAATAAAEEKSAPQNFLLVGLCGSENPTRANFPFVWAAALREAGNEVRIELAGDGTVMASEKIATTPASPVPFWPGP